MTTVFSILLSFYTKTRKCKSAKKCFRKQKYIGRNKPKNEKGGKQGSKCPYNKNTTGSIDFQRSGVPSVHTMPIFLPACGVHFRYSHVCSISGCVVARAFSTRHLSFHQNAIKPCIFRVCRKKSLWNPIGFL